MQREVLARLESAEGWMTISELVGEAGRSRYESIRRAISRLADSGLIERGSLAVEVPDGTPWAKHYEGLGSHRIVTGVRISVAYSREHATLTGGRRNEEK